MRSDDGPVDFLLSLFSIWMARLGPRRPPAMVATVLPRPLPI
jgi:hypothetical protein